MAPEILDQNRHVMYSFASDVYSLGIVTATIFNMKPPYDQNLRAFKIRRGVLNGMRPELPNCPVVLKSLIQRSWSSDPRERPTAAEFLQVLSATRSSIVEAEISANSVKSNVVGT